MSANPCRVGARRLCRQSGLMGFIGPGGILVSAPETPASRARLPALEAAAFALRVDQASRTVGNWNAPKSFWAIGCMNIVSAAIPSWFSVRSWMECALQRRSAPRE
jgi:hypothetical protein